MTDSPDHDEDSWGPSTTAIHHGYDPASAQGALTPPIYMTSTYAFPDTEAGAAVFRGEAQGYVYGRRHNPTQTILEDRMARLEGGAAAVAMASGIACITTPMWTLLQAGDEVVIDHTLYGNTYAFFMQGLTRFGVKVTKVDMTRLDTLQAALTARTRVVYFETPANPNLRVIDIRAVSDLAKRVAPGALVVVDNTFCTPILQRPLDHGADLVLHSATKFLSGHGDVLGGVLVGPADIIARVRNEGLRYLTGATLSPMNAHLVLRGLKTLEIRMAQHSRSATAVAQLLESHSAVERVFYPGLESHPQFALASRQMQAPGGLVAFELRRGIEAGRRFMDRLRVVTLAVSLGDAESLVQHPASMTHANYTPEERAAQGIGEGLVRLSVGLENTPDILADIEQALGNL
ncbi:trans-sulfuration enzyme family protein [Inquilinus sp.]|jgi:methionine-gamma-lyase|uniref:trans-sulfuration enzyme family protein n=1 Tax=Inquilinus sp. TaxID=1932117 RepID=UPI003782FBA8